MGRLLFNGLAEFLMDRSASADGEGRLCNKRIASVRAADEVALKFR
jgi:hypothetical protein